MDTTTALFYVFSAVLLFSGFRVITARSPVHAALFLVLAFFSASCVWMLLHAEFLAISLVLVYVGAVMVLFLFVVMMLDINLDLLRQGFWKHFPVAGLVGVLASLAAWLLAGWAAFHYGGRLALQLADGPDPDATEMFGGYALCFLGVLVCVGLVGWIVRRLVHGIGLSGLDRLLGAALGALRGALVACALLLLLGFTSLPRDAAWRDSRLVPALLPGAQWLRGWLPPWAAREVDFGKRAPPRDNGGLIELPVPLDEGVRPTPPPASTDSR